MDLSRRVRSLKVPVKFFLMNLVYVRKQVSEIWGDGAGKREYIDSAFHRKYWLFNSKKLPKEHFQFRNAELHFPSCTEAPLGGRP